MESRGAQQKSLAKVGRLLAVLAEPAGDDVAGELQDLLRQTKKKAARLRAKLLREAKSRSGSRAALRLRAVDGPMCPRFREPSLARRAGSRSGSRTGTGAGRGKSKKGVASKRASQHKHQHEQQHRCASRVARAPPTQEKSRKRTSGCRDSQAKQKRCNQRKQTHNNPHKKQASRSHSRQQSRGELRAASRSQSRPDSRGGSREPSRAEREESRRQERQQLREASREQLHGEIQQLDSKIEGIESAIGDQIRAIQVRLKARLEKKQKQIKDVCGEL